METSFIYFSSHVPILLSIVTKSAFLMGCFFILRAFLKLKIYGEMRSMMAPQGRMAQIFLLLFTGALLIYFPYTTQDVLIEAILGTTPTIKGVPYAYTTDWSDELKKSAELIMRLIGNLTLVRGITQLGSYQEGGRHSLSKSLTHIVAGVCAIKIDKTLDLLKYLVGVD